MRREDDLEGAERRLVKRHPVLSELLAELTDGEVDLYAVWVHRPHSRSVPRDLACRFEALERKYLRPNTGESFSRSSAGES
jgi:hypothetical protein